MMKLIFISIISFFIWIPMSYAANVTIAQDPWPPFIIDNSNTPGISVEIVTAAMKTQGYDVTFKVMPWARALDQVKKGAIDMLPATWFTKKRSTYLIYSNSYLKNNIKIIKLSGSPFMYQDLKSLDGKKVGIIRGYGYNDQFLTSKRFKRPASKDLVTNLKKLKSKRIDLTISDELVARSLMKKNKINANDFSFSKKNMSTNKIFVTSGKANPNGQKYIKAFNKGLTVIQSDGTFNKILKKYGQ